MCIGRWIGILTVVLVASPGMARGQTVVDAPRGFTFAVPNGLYAITSADPSYAAYAFATSDPRGGLPDAAIFLRPMDRPVRTGVRPSLAANAPANSTFVQRKWGTTDVWVLNGDVWYQGHRMNGREVHVPLDGDGLTLVLVVRQGAKLSADGLLDKALAGLHAISPSGDVPSSPSDRESAEAAGEHLGYGLAILGLLFALVVRWVMTYLTRD